MSDGEQLLLILSLIYLSGCLFWVDRRTVLFVMGLGGAWRAITADYRWGNSKGRFFLLNPFPSLSLALTIRLMPVSLSPTHIVAYNLQTIGNSGRPSQSRREAEILPETRFSRRGTELLVGGKFFCDIGNICTAHGLVVLLNRIKHCEEGARAKAIYTFWEDRLSLRKTKKQIRSAISSSLWMRIVCSLAFPLFFIIPPAVAIRYNVGFAVLIGAASMLSTTLMICLLFFSCHRKHYPYFKEGFYGDLTKMLFCPPTALRACDLIMKRLSAQLDILPTAILLLHGSEREQFLKEYFSDLKEPYIPEDFPDAVRKTCLWQNDAIVKSGTTVIRGLARLTSS